MFMDADDRLTRACRDWALCLTERPSVTGTADEAAFGPWLAGQLREAFPKGEVWTLPVAPGDPRACVALLVRGEGAATVLLTGHYDTVTTADYSHLEPLAIRPEALLPALIDATRAAEPGTAAARCHADLVSGRFLPGRGLLDMKAGLAAGLAAMAAFAEDWEARGNLLFLAVPDEENASAGARAGAAGLAEMARERGLDLVAAVNLDAVADDGDGTAGQVVALGTVGKVLPSALVLGAPVHAGFPLRGVNAGALAGAVAAAVEWHPALTDTGGSEPGAPITLLRMRDLKPGYDVTTPGAVHLYWNALNLARDPATVLDALEGVVREALAAALERLRERGGGPLDAQREAPILRWGELLEEVRARAPGVDNALAAEARRGLTEGRAFPDVAGDLLALLWERSGRRGPAALLALGSTPYLATALADDRVAKAVAGLVSDAPARHGVALGTVAHFPGISDVSFWGQADAAVLPRLARDTPAWEVGVVLDRDSVAGLPTVNLGPWGRDYHTPWERIATDYGFRAMPRLLLDFVGRLLGT